MRAAGRDRRIWDLPAVRMLYDLFLLRRARKTKAALPALAHGLTFLGGHRAVRLRYGHADGVMLLRAVCEARRIDRCAIARCRRIVRSRCSGRCTGAAREERLAVGVLAHAAAAARTGRTGAGRVVYGRCCCCSGGGGTRLVLVRRDFGAREVRGAHMPHYAVGVKVAVKVLWATAVATPAEYTDEKDGD